MSDISDVVGTGLETAGKGFDFGSNLLDRLKGIPIASRTSAASKSINKALKDLDNINAFAEERGLDPANNNKLQRIALKLHIGEENVDETLELVPSLLRREPRVDEIDHSWFIKWEHKAAEQFDDELRSIFAQILAGELEEPGSYSKRTLSIVADMGLSDANAFKSLCSLCAGGIDQHGTEQPIIPCLFLDDSNVSYNEGSLSYEDALRLEAMGLIKTRTSTYFSEGQQPILCIDGTSYLILTDSPRFKIGEATLTPYGEELAALCSKGNAEGLLRCVKKQLDSMNAKLLSLDLPHNNSQ